MGSDIRWTLFSMLFSFNRASLYSFLRQLKMGSGTAIVITDVTIAKDLMDKRSQSTIDRPANHISERIVGGMNMALARYSKSQFLWPCYPQLTPS